MNIDSAVFYSKDINRVVDFYQNVIGLELEYQQSDTYVSFLFANNVRLGIKRAIEEREVSGAQTVFIAVDDIETLYARLQKENAEIIKELQHTESFGLNFSILDPDKNKVQFVKRD